MQNKAILECGKTTNFKLFLLALEEIKNNLADSDPGEGKEISENVCTLLDNFNTKDVTELLCRNKAGSQMVTFFRNKFLKKSVHCLTSSGIPNVLISFDGIKTTLRNIKIKS